MRLGIVLGGGFARGAAQLAFLEGLLPFINEKDIALISSSSIGGVNALAYSSGNIPYLDNVYRTIDLRSLGDVMKALKGGIVSRLLAPMVTDPSKIKVPFYVTGTCMNTLSTHYFYLDSSKSSEELEKALNITVTFPFINGLVRRDGRRFYLDGGALDNIPTFPFLQFDVDVLLIIHNYPRYLPSAEIVKKVPVVIDVDDGTRLGNGFPTYSFKKEVINKAMDASYAYGAEFGRKVFEGHTNLSEIKEAGQQFIREELPKRMKNKNNTAAAIFFNKLQQAREFHI